MFIICSYKRSLKGGVHLFAVEYKKKADAKIHYNSFKSAQQKALPYIQRSDTHAVPKACYVVQSARNSCIQRIMPRSDELGVDGGKGTREEPYYVLVVAEEKNANADVDADANAGAVIEEDEEGGKTAKQRALYAISKKAGAIGEKLNLTGNESLEVIIIAKYRTRRNRKTVQLQLRYYFGNGTESHAHGNGYVIEIIKERLTSEGLIDEEHRHRAIMVEKEDPASVTSGSKYDSTHAGRFGETVLDETYRKGKDTNSNVRTDTDIEGKHFDAYTKLAGEGARFECVREHMDSIREDTYFCSGTNAITFVNLWQNWKDVFDMKYNIPTAMVKEFLDTAWTGGIDWAAEEDGKYAVKYDNNLYYYFDNNGDEITNKKRTGKQNRKSLFFKLSDSQFIWTEKK